MSKRKNPEEFEKEMYEVWGDQIELLTPYTRSEDKILVRFKSCGHECWKSPQKLRIGHGCDFKECRYGLLSKNKTRSSSEFVSALAKKNRPVELLSEYTGIKNKVVVKNLLCGHVYSASANNILNGSGCPVCHGMKDTEGFAKMLDEKYPGEYTVLGTYKNNRTNILVRHNKCGFEWEAPPKHLSATFSCPNCNKSLGEHMIEVFLKEHGLEFIPQYMFEDCRDQRKLPFDFAVFINGEIRLVEFDGTHHFRKFKGWGEKSVLSSVKKHDQIKNEYCASRGIPLLRIPYWKRDCMSPDLEKFLEIKP